MLQRALKYAADGKAPEVIAVIEIGNLGLQNGVRIARGRRNVFEDGFEERTQILGGIVQRLLRHTGSRVGVEDREIELVFLRVEIDEEVVDFVEDLRRARIRPVDLVDDDDRLQLGFESFHQNVTGLRERAFARVDEQHDAVDDLEGALDFAAEIAVAGRIDDVDLGAVETHAGDLGEDGDAAFAFEIVRIHHALGDFFVRAENAALAKHGVDQRGLAVVDVRNDGYVSGVLAHLFLV